MEPFFEDVRLWLEALGPWAWVAAPAVMAAVAVLPLPAEVPAVLNGLLFGPAAGTAVTWVGAMAGAWISFEAARAWGRPAAERLLPAGALARVDGLVAGAGWGGMLAARFVPLISFTALNWGSGLARVPRGRFLWTTAVGIAPGAVVFTASGYGLAVLLERASPALAVAATLALVALLAWRWRKGRAGDAPGEPAPPA